MIVLVYSNIDGPQLVASLPDDPKAAPQYFTASSAPPGYATIALTQKGAKEPWSDYAQSLTTTAPYFGWWSTVDLPLEVPLSGAISFLQAQELFGGTDT